MVKEDSSGEQAHGFIPMFGTIGLGEDEVETAFIDDIAVAKLLLDSNDVFLCEHGYISIFVLFYTYTCVCF